MDGAIGLAIGAVVANVVSIGLVMIESARTKEEF